LREALIGYLQDRGLDGSVDNIRITSGSQGALDAIAKILITKGDKIALEAPTFLGAIQAFDAYEPEYVCIKMDQDGLIPDSLEEILQHNTVKFIYLVPTFQNPSGRTTTLKRREKIAAIIKKHNALVVEDDPYSSLRYRGSSIRSIYSLAPDNVVYMSTLSKVFAPGLRIGFYIAPPLIRRWMDLAKQGVDLHTSTFSQALAAEYIEGGYLDKQLDKIIQIYKPRQEAMLNTMDECFPESFNWSKPEGGMFVWVEGPEGTDIERIYNKSVQRNVAFVPGKFFYVEPGAGLATMRLNYTMSDEGSIIKAIKILSDVVRQEL